MCFFIRKDEMNKIIPFINIHTHRLVAEDELSIFNAPNYFDLSKHTNFASIGIHPWNIQTINSKECIDFIRLNASAKNVLAIGECGLDKLVETNIQIQEDLFKLQICIAESVKKPMIIHCVKAFDELLQIKKELNISIPLIVHGYNNNEQIAEQLVQNNFYISFGKALLKEDSNASKIISMIPIEKVFLETDDTAIPIKSIFEKAATYLQMDVQSLKEKININFKQLFTYE